MNNKNIYVNFQSMIEVKQKMDDGCNELISILNHCKQLFDETKRIYDTESGDMYRQAAIDYLKTIEEYINDNYRAYINYLDNIRKLYMDEVNKISISIGGNAE